MKKFKPTKDFLQKTMIKFKKISLNQILVISEVIRSSTLFQIEFLRQKYLKNEVDFENMLFFLEKLELIRIMDNKILVAHKYQHFLGIIGNSKKPEEVLRRFLVDTFILKRNAFSEYLTDFFSRFRQKGVVYTFIPTYSQRLQYSNLRNFLMELELLFVNSSTNAYILAKECVPFVKFGLVKPLSLEQFKKDLQRKYEIGLAAENQIILYEKSRLSKHPLLANKVEHVAIKDVAAGYDIKSFEISKPQRPIIRFIEVKAVAKNNYKFNWTRNEIEKAKICMNKYYLYLLPVIESNRFDVDSLKMIKNPYKNIYRNKHYWLCTEELLSFSLNRT